MRPPTAIRRTARLAIAALLAAPLVSGPEARAETVVPSILQEGTFWRLQERAPVVETPNGPVSPGAQNPPNVTDGTMVVAHAGGPAGPDKGDQMWAAMEFDVLDAGLEATVDAFSLTLYLAPQARGDFSAGGPPTFMACNVVTPFGVSEGTNPWVDRPPTDCTSAKSPTTSKTGLQTYTFDLKDYAQSWVDGKGFGIVLRPGVPGSPGPVNSDQNQMDIPPFQITFATSQNTDTRFRPKVSFSYTPAEEDDLFGGGGGGFDDLGGFDDMGGGFEDLGGGFGDDLGGDAGFEDLGAVEEAAPIEEAAPAEEPVEEAPSRTVRTQRTASTPGFPWYLLLLLPLGLVAFWGTGTALGEAGDPVEPRTGGVSRVLARRRMAGSTTSPTTEA